MTDGVAVTLDPQATIDVGAKGQVLIGASLAINFFNAKLVVVGSGSSLHLKLQRVSATFGLCQLAEIAVAVFIPRKFTL